MGVEGSKFKVIFLIMTFIYIFVTSLILQFFLPWWIIGPVAFAFAGGRSPNGWHAFRIGFLAIFSLWVIVALFKTLPNENLLANRVAQMLMLPDMKYNWFIMLLVTGLIGGIAAGLAALSGFYFAAAIVPKRRDELSLSGEKNRSRRTIFHKVKRTV